MNQPVYQQNMKSDYDLAERQFDAIFDLCRGNAGDFRDPQTDEVNATGLAEFVAYSLDHDEWLDVDGHPLWDIAAYVAEVRSNPAIQR
jgi:hypothetical protein